MPERLTHRQLLESTQLLAGKDPDFARVVEKHGPPPLWDRPPGFETLVRIILEQQVSLKSADAMYRRLQHKLPGLTPAAILKAGEKGLRDLGVTRQKASYFVNVASAVEHGELDFQVLESQEDEAVIGSLTSIKGIGPWTANVYLLMAMCRPDVWPPGDIALATAYQTLKSLHCRPSSAELDDIALAWQPHRATAARILWHHYLSG